MGTDGVTEIRSNDDWKSASNSADIVAATIPPQNPAESRPPYKPWFEAHENALTSANETTGISLIEVYEINRD